MPQKKEKTKSGVKKTEQTTLVENEKGKIVCLNCGCKNQANFYQSHNRFNKHFGSIPYCKDCIRGEMYQYYLKKYKDNEQLALHGLLRSVNVPYIHSVYLASIKNLNNPNAKINNVNEDILNEDNKENNGILVSAYFKNYNSLHDKNGYGNTYDDSEGLSEIQNLSFYEDIIKIQRKKKTESVEDIDTEVYDIIEYDASDLVNKWGDFEDEELIFLENEYLDWKDKIGDYIEEKSTDLLVKEICLQTQEIRKKRQLKEKTKEEISTLQQLLNNSGLLEKQAISANAKKGMGVRIAELEEYRPIKPVDTALDDVDGYRNMIYSIAGCLCKALNKENEYTRLADEILKPYNLDSVQNLDYYSSENIADNTQEEEEEDGE